MARPSSLPPDYVRLFEERPSPWVLSGLALLLFFPAFSLFSGLRAWWLGQEAPETFRLGLNQWLLMLFIGGPLLLVLHEGAHGMTMRWMGHRPRYGFRGLYAYATADGAVFTRNQFLAVALAPLFLLTPPGLAFLVLPSFPGWPYAAFFLAANVAGSVGDLWLALKLLRLPASVRVVDREVGMEVFGPPGTPVPPWGWLEGLLRWMGTTVVWGMGLFLFTYVVVLPLLARAGADAWSLPPWWVYRKVGEGFSVEVNFWPFVATAAPLSAGWLYWRARKGKA